MYTEHRPPRIRALVFALVLALLVTACAPAAPQGAAPEAAAPEASASSVATISFTQEPDSLNPLYTTMWFSGILTDIYLVGLWNFNDAVEPTLQLARELPSAENGGISEDAASSPSTCAKTPPGLMASRLPPLTSSSPMR